MLSDGVASHTRLLGIGARPGVTVLCAALMALGALGWSAIAPPRPSPTPQSFRLDAANAPTSETGASLDTAGFLPLSIDESCLMLIRASQLCADRSTPLTTDTLTQADRILQTVMVYIERIDGAHPTLPFYAWQEVTSQKAPKAGWETRTFKLTSPLPQVTALSIKARHGDMEIKDLAAVDADRTRWEFNRTIRVPANLPRPEICFLALPTELAEVRVTLRRTDPAAPRLARITINAGISGIPESAKQARYHLQMARGALRRGALAEARGKIRQAWQLLKEYQKSRRF